MSDSSDLKPGTLCYIKGCGDPYANGKVVEVIGPYMGTDCDPSDHCQEVWADWLNNGTYGEPRRGWPRRGLHPINPPGVEDSLPESSNLPVSSLFLPDRSVEDLFLPPEKWT